MSFLYAPSLSAFALSNDAQESSDGALPAVDFTRQNTDVMSRMDKLAQESAAKLGHDTDAQVAEFSLSGLVPRAEPDSIRRFRSKDVYIRLENRIYGPLTQDELGELLASGNLTGFESASSDLRTWTPLIYHPKMMLAGEIDPDQTHDVLHKRSDLPAASRAAEAIDLETFGDEPEEETAPAMPLAAILIKPVRVSRKTGEVLDAPVLADLDEESLEDVIERMGLPEMPPIPADASGDNRKTPLGQSAAKRLASLTPPPLPAAATGRQDAIPAPPTTPANDSLAGARPPAAPHAAATPAAAARPSREQPVRTEPGQAQPAPMSSAVVTPAPMPPPPKPVAPQPAPEPLIGGPQTAHAQPNAQMPAALELPSEPMEFEITSEPLAALAERHAPRTSSTSPGVTLTEEDREKHSEYVRTFFTASNAPIVDQPGGETFEPAAVGLSQALAPPTLPEEQSSPKMIAIAVAAGLAVLAVAWFVLTKLSGTPAL
ncbi:MAG: hypothetical protein ACJA1R_000997 [Flavobacteriales bacterium]